MTDRRLDLQQKDDELETLMIELGRARYRGILESSSRNGRFTDAKPGRILMRGAVEKLADGIAQWVEQARAGRGSAALQYVEQFKPEVVAFVTARSVLDSIAFQSSLVSSAYKVGQRLMDEARHDAIRKAKSSLWRDLSRRLKRSRRPSHKRKMIRAVAAKLGATVEEWPKREQIRVGVVLIELLRIHTGLVEVRTIPRPGRRPQAVVVPTESTLSWIEEANRRNELLDPVYLPTHTPPRDWTDPWDGGYRTNILIRRPLVKARNRDVVLEVEKGKPEIVYRAINAVQRTAWQVNRKVFDVAEILWKSGAPVAGFQERVDELPPERPSAADVDPDVASQFTRARADWRRRVVAARGRRVLAAKTLHVARMHLDVPEFFYPHQVDFRGRAYPVPYHLQPQGDDLSRGLLHFARGKAIRDAQAAQWFQGSGAALYGVNRVANRARVEWVRTNHEKILATAADPVGLRWWADAEEPFQFLAWVLEYAEWFRAPAKFISHLPVKMDGSCNGLQLYSLLVRDEVGAAAVNVVPADAPHDVYQEVADAATEELMVRSHEPEAAKWLEFLEGRVPRSFVKRPTMTLVYGSTFHSCANYVRDEYEALRMKRGGVTPFNTLNGAGYRACSYLGRIVWDAIGKKVGPARAAMDWLRLVATHCAALDLPVTWTAPSGFRVLQRYTKFESRRIRTAVGDEIRFCRYREDGASIAAGEQSNGLPPNFVHSLDASVFSFAVCRALERDVRNFQVIHDSFGVLAADAPKMASALREVVSEVFSVDLLAEFKAEIERTLPEGVVLPALPEYGELNPEVARHSTYLYS